jgi:phenylacetate-CoA ligase
VIRSTFSFIIKTAFLGRRLTILNLKKKRYLKITSQEEIYRYQIEAFNKTWNFCVNNIPFYKKWQKDFNLPLRINSIQDLKLFPVLTKNYINQNQDFILKGLTNYYLTSTGGTSGVTTHFPTSKANADEAYANSYLGRSWWDIDPLDNILMFWGHSHLFGKGLYRYIRKFRRWLSDILINTRRISCYDLDSKSVHSFYEAIKSLNPKAIISYSSNVFKVCQYMKSNSLAINDSMMKGVILTSESVTKRDIQLIEKYLNTNVINEYGMAETGSIAYSYEKTNNIRIFWDSFIVTNNENKELFLTTIGPSVFPLINYSSEDLIEVKSEYKQSVLYISSILGKVRDVLNISMINGKNKEISTIFFDHVLKFYPDIYSIHYSQKESSVEISFTSDKKLNLFDIKNYMIKEISKEFNDINFSCLNLKQIAETKKTLAGKNQTLI